MINTVYDQGITFFDLADIYQEAPFGEALRGSPSLRDKIVIQSKCGIVIEGTPPDQSVYLDTSRDDIVSAVEESLRRLGTDYLDILLLHAKPHSQSRDRSSPRFIEVKSEKLKD